MPLQSALTSIPNQVDFLKTKSGFKGSTVSGKQLDAISQERNTDIYLPSKPLGGWLSVHDLLERDLGIFSGDIC